MRRPLRYLSSIVVLLVLSRPINAQENERPPDPRSEEMRLEGERSQRAYEDHQRQIQGFQRSFRTAFDSPFSDTGRELSRRRNAHHDLIELATDLQRLYDLSREPTLVGNSLNEIASRSKDSANGVGKLLDFINRGTEPPPTYPFLIPEESFEERVRRLVALFRHMIEPTVELIAGDVLDLNTLAEVRSGFAAMGAMLSALPDSDFR